MKKINDFKFNTTKYLAFFGLMLYIIFQLFNEYSFGFLDSSDILSISQFSNFIVSNNVMLIKIIIFTILLLISLYLNQKQIAKKDFKYLLLIIIIFILFNGYRITLGDLAVPLLFIAISSKSMKCKYLLYGISVLLNPYCIIYAIFIEAQNKSKLCLTRYYVIATSLLFVFTCSNTLFSSILIENFEISIIKTFLYSLVLMISVILLIYFYSKNANAKDANFERDIFVCSIILLFIPLPSYFLINRAFYFLIPLLYGLINDRNLSKYEVISYFIICPLFQMFFSNIFIYFVVLVFMIIFMIMRYDFKIFSRLYIGHISIIAFILMIAIVTFYGYTQAIHGFPLSEGWYTVYAELINNGQIPYLDFELLFPPLYVYIITIVINIFGKNIIVLRIFGLLIFISIALLNYFTYKKHFGIVPTLFSSILLVLFMQSEIAQVFYDYIRIYDLFNMLIIFMMVRLVYELYLKNITNMKLSFFIGVVSGLSILIRQSSGMIVSAYILIIFIVISIMFTKKFNNIIIYIIGLLVPLLLTAIYLSKVGALDAFLLSTTSDALAAKGGIFTVLFAWIPNSISIFYSQLPFALIIIITALFTIYATRNMTFISHNRINLYISIVVLMLTLMILLLAFNYKCIAKLILPYANLVGPYLIYILVLALFIYQFILFFVNYNNKSNSLENWIYLVSSGLSIAIGYGAGTSGGLSEGQTALGLAIISIFLCRVIMKTNVRIIVIIFLSLLSFLSLGYGVRKYLTLYSWWGVAQTNIWENDYITDVPILQGIYVDSSTNDLINDIYYKLNDNYNEDAELFVFPHIPIFYEFSPMRKFDSKTIVQWFDVSTDYWVNEDLENVLKEKPDFIIYALIPTPVIEAHESLFRNGNSTVQKQFINDLQIDIDNGEYSIIGEYVIGSWGSEPYVARLLKRG